MHSEWFCSERPGVFHKQVFVQITANALLQNIFSQQLYSLYPLVPFALPVLSTEAGLLFRKHPKMIGGWQERDIRVAVCPFKSIKHNGLWHTEQILDVLCGKGLDIFSNLNLILLLTCHYMTKSTVLFFVKIIYTI